MSTRVTKGFMADRERLIDEPKNRVTTVPKYFYDTKGWCRLTKASFLWWANAVCAVFHLTLAGALVVVSTRNGKTMATPKLTVYLTSLEWRQNSTDALIPTFQATEGLSLAWMVLFFFLLSAIAHGTIAVFNYKQACLFTVSEENRVITRWTGWYFLFIHQCRNPLRYMP